MNMFVVQPGYASASLAHGSNQARRGLINTSEREREPHYFVITLNPSIECSLQIPPIEGLAHQEWACLPQNLA